MRGGSGTWRASCAIAMSGRSSWMRRLRMASGSRWPNDWPMMPRVMPDSRTFRPRACGFSAPQWRLPMADDLGVSLQDIEDLLESRGLRDGFDDPPDPTPAPASPLEFEPPKIVEGLDAETYHADTGSVGAGGLSLLRRSPLHHWHACRRPGRTPEAPTDAQRFGTAVHCALLEPDQFDARVAFRPDCDRRTKEGKAICAEFSKSLGNRLELNAGARDKIAEIVAAVASHPAAAMLMSGDGLREASVYWTDSLTGVRCRCRPD